MEALPRIEGMGMLQFLRSVQRHGFDHSYVEVRQKYGTTVGMRWGGREYVVTFNPEDIQHVLRDNYKNYTKGYDYNEFLPMAANVPNVFLSSGDAWRNQRRVCSPEFQPARIADYMPIILRRTEELLGTMSAKPERDLSADMSQLVLGITCEAFFGSDDLALVEELLQHFPISSEVVEWRMRLPFRPPRWIPLPAHRREKRANDTLVRITDELIAKRRERPPSDDLLGRLLRATDGGIRLSPQELRSNILLFLVAGYETTANSLGWTFYLLAKYGQAQEAARQEVRQVLQGHAPTPELLGKLDLLPRIYQESLRLFPPARSLSRQAIENDRLPGTGTAVAAKTNVAVPIYALHRDPALWPEPERFDPDRFLPAAEKARNPFAMIPFARGARECIGKSFAMQEALTILAMVLRKYTIGLRDPSYVPRFKLGIIMSPEGGVPVRLVPTQN